MSVPEELLKEIKNMIVSSLALEDVSADEIETDAPLFGEGLGFAIPVAYVKHFLENREAFAFNQENPNTGHRYLTPPRRRRAEPPPANLFTAGAKSEDRSEAR